MSPPLVHIGLLAPYIPAGCLKFVGGILGGVLVFAGTVTRPKKIQKAKGAFIPQNAGNFPVTVPQGQWRRSHGTGGMFFQQSSGTITSVPHYLMGQVKSSCLYTTGGNRISSVTNCFSFWGLRSQCRPLPGLYP